MEYDRVLGCFCHAAPSHFEAATQRPPPELANVGRLLELTIEIDAAGEHTNAALSSRQECGLSSGKRFACIGSEDQCGAIKLLSSIVISQISVHQQMREPVVLDRKVHANLLTAKQREPSALRSIHRRCPRYS